MISLADVLEHVPFPKDFLRHAHELLADDGVLFVSMPNADALVWKTLERAGTNPYFGELEHLHNFGRKRLTALLEECGFSVVSYGISERYLMCMELIVTKQRPTSNGLRSDLLTPDTELGEQRVRLRHFGEHPEDVTHVHVNAASGR